MRGLTIPITMAESHKSNGNDGFYLGIVSGVVAVGFVALRHSGCRELECFGVCHSYRFAMKYCCDLIGGFRIGA